MSEALPKAEDAFVPLLRRLATGDYNSTRIASAPLFATVYTRVGEASKAEMRQYAPPLSPPPSRRDSPLVTRWLEQWGWRDGLAAACRVGPHTGLDRDFVNNPQVDHPREVYCPLR